MKHTSKILALVLVLMTVLMSLSAITASAATETVTYVLDAGDLAVQTGISDTLTAGTDNYFTIYTNNSKVEAKSTSFDDGYKSVNRLSLNGNSKISGDIVSRSIAFTTAGKATVKIWWICGGDGRNIELYNSNLEVIAQPADASTAKDAKNISTFEIEAAGTYYIGHSAGTSYFFRIEVAIQIETCDHAGGTATCKDQAICSKCEQPYGELTEDHDFADGACTICGTPDPDACQHTEMAPATCTAPATCECGYTEGEALGHDMVVDTAVAPTCTEKGLTEGSHCSRCDEVVAQTEVAALGHTLTFVNTLPTAEAAGKTIADCSVCQAHFDFGEVNVMTGGTYVLDAAALEGIAQYSLFDGEVKVVGGVFACHLSYKYRTDANAKTFAADDWVSTHRMNFGGASGFCNNGEGEAAVRNGGLKNYIQIVTTNTTTLTFHWGVGDANREIGVYDMEGNLVASTTFAGAKNDLAYSVLEVPAGAYLIGAHIGEGVSSGGNYMYKLTVDVETPHVHDYADATCTAPATCDCGATQGEALGHEYVEGKCSRCEAADPDYVPEEKPEDKPEDKPAEQPAKEMNWFEKLIAMIIDFFKKLFGLA